MLVLWLLAACSADPSALPFEEIQGFQHPNVHINGFRLASVFMVAHDKDTHKPKALHQRRLRFDAHPHLLDSRRLAEDLPEFTSNNSQNSADRVFTLLKLNMLAMKTMRYACDYGSDRPCQSFSEKTYSELIANGDMMYAPNGTKREDDWDGMDVLTNAIEREVNGTDGVNTSFIYMPPSIGEFKNGWGALEFVRGDVTVLAFRGSYNDGEFENVQNFHFDYILERMTAKLKYMWTDLAGLPWGPEQQDREDNGDLGIRISMRTVFQNNNPWTEGMATKVYNAVKDDKDDEENNKYLKDVDYSLEDAKNYAYWPLTRHFLDIYLANRTSTNSTNSPLMFSGFSQGGTRAQLATMYARTKKNQDIHSLTFGATGARCASKLLWSNKNLLADVNPDLNYSSAIIDYTHPLDAWGSGLGEDTGTECYFGIKNITQSKAYEYCSKIWGLSGVTLVAAGTLTVPGGGADENTEAQFSRCRYLTHLLRATYQHLSLPGALTADGIPTTGFCQPATTERSCPTGEWQDDELGASAAIIAVISLSVICCLGCCILGAVMCCKKRKEANRKRNMPLN